VKVSVGSDAFSFRPHPGANFEVTHAFEGAKVKGKTTRAVVEKGTVTIRLQGIDAAELHYQPMPASASGAGGR